jgi:hypothetical protein
LARFSVATGEVVRNPSFEILLPTDAVSLPSSSPYGLGFMALFNYV